MTDTQWAYIDDLHRRMRATISADERAWLAHELCRARMQAEAE